jgi:two-component sensor histidine kinase
LRTFKKLIGKSMEENVQISNREVVETTPECPISAISEAIAIPPAEFIWLRELTHRINNELASTIGVITLDANRSENSGVKLALARVIEHLYDHACLYRTLQIPQENNWIDATSYLRGLCQSISRVKLQRKGIQLVFVEHSVWLTSIQCWKLGMIVSELITNSCRHAFGDRDGLIRVELKTRGLRAECRITDNGKGSEMVQSGNGTKIVQQLALALDGGIDLRFGADGAIATICFQIAGPVESRGRDRE